MEKEGRQANRCRSSALTSTIPLCPTMARILHSSVKQSWASTQTAFNPAACSQSPSFRASRANKERKLMTSPWAEIPSSCWKNNQGGNVKKALNEERNKNTLLTSKTDPHTHPCSNREPLQDSAVPLSPFLVTTLADITGTSCIYPYYVSVK